MNLLPPSLVLPIDVTSRLSGMCTCITLGRPQVEEMAAAIFCWLSSVPSYQQEYNVTNKSTAIFSLVFPNGYSLILCFDAIQSELLKESLNEQLNK
jgi:hypothetical protein